jgi:peptide/nickel transport system substrate-binding protein
MARFGNAQDSGGDRDFERRLLEQRLLSRRELVKGIAAAGAATAVGGLLAACGGSESAEPQGSATAPGSTPATAPETTAPETTAAAGSEIKRGGRLRVGHVGGGNVESFNPAVGSTYVDVSRFYNLYDPLVFVDAEFNIVPGLALEWTPNSDSTTWEIKLRPDVVWHDGKPFTADDVLFTLRSLGDTKHVAHGAVANVRLAEATKTDDLTVVLPLKGPDARPFDAFTQQQTVIIQDGQTDFAKPVGTGPFSFESFTIGQRSLCVRNPSYWQEGKPYVEEWEDISIDDPQARLNALLSGEIDALTQLSQVQAKAQLDAGQIQVVEAPSPSVQVFFMAVDIEPFTDPRVREAFRLIPDRQALVDIALAGFATPGNDLVGNGLPYFGSDFPVREQDLERAKSLLEEAGQAGLEVTVHTADIVPGFVEAATLFAEQAKGAGVKVNVKKEAANAYFDTSKLYTKLDFGNSFWTMASLGAFYTQAMLSDAVWNETHWRDPEFDKLIRAAQAATSEEAAAEAWHRVQEIQYNEGGYIVWANVSLLDAVGSQVRGVVPSGFFNLGGPSYRDLWLDV